MRFLVLQLFLNVPEITKKVKDWKYREGKGKSKNFQVRIRRNKFKNQENRETFPTES